MDMTLLAEAVLAARNVSWGLVLAAPLAAAAALVLWVRMTRHAAKNPREPQKRFKDQDNHRGREQGGYYQYTPGAYSHSYNPDETSYNDENR
jgi:uncharacterized cupin superfamily protein